MCAAAQRREALDDLRFWESWHAAASAVGREWHAVLHGEDWEAERGRHAGLLQLLHALHVVHLLLHEPHLLCLCVLLLHHCSWVLL